MATDLVPTRNVAIIKHSLSETAAQDALQLLDERGLAKLALLLGETQDILASDKEGAPIQNDEEEAALTALTGRAYKVEQEAEAMRKARVAPLQAEVKAVGELVKLAFGQLLARMGKASDAERRLSAWRRVKAARIQREKEESDRRMREAAEKEAQALAEADAAKNAEQRRAAHEKAEAASREQMAAELLAPRQMTRGVKTEDGKRMYHNEWTFEIVDAAMVPRSYCIPDEKLIRAAVKTGTREIPGVSVFEQEVARRGV